MITNRSSFLGSITENVQYKSPLPELTQSPGGILLVQARRQWAVKWERVVIFAARAIIVPATTDPQIFSFEGAIRFVPPIKIDRLDP